MATSNTEMTTGATRLASQSFLRKLSRRYANESVEGQVSRRKTNAGTTSKDAATVTRDRSAGFMRSLIPTFRSLLPALFLSPTMLHAADTTNAPLTACRGTFHWHSLRQLHPGLAIGAFPRPDVLEAPPSVESQIHLKNLGLIASEDYIAWEPSSACPANGMETARCHGASFAQVGPQICRL